MAKRYFVKFE